MTKSDPLLALVQLCRKHPALEAQVIWAMGGEWQPQEDEDQGLDGEEIAFYAEGMLIEGYACAWQVLGQGGPEFVRLFFWQGDAPPLPDDPDLLGQGQAAPSA
jgi:hypothetical protein